MKYSIFFFILLMSCSAEQLSQSKLIIGADNRAEVLAIGYPYSAIGRLFVGFTDEECTASLIWRNLIISSAHCVKGRQNIGFSPNYVDNEIRLRNGLALRSGENILSQAQIVAIGNYTSAKEIDQDWAILRLDNALGDKFNWLDIDTGIAQLEGAISLVGYSLDFFRYVQGRGVAGIDSSCQISSEDRGVVSHNCDSTEGASGAPLFRMSTDFKVTLFAVHSSGDTSVNPARNLAVATRSIKAQIAAAIAAEAQRIGNQAAPERVVVDANGNRLSEPPAAGIKQVAAGNYHNCVLYKDGKVRCWGSGDDGRLGYGNKNNIGDDELPSNVGYVDVGGEVEEISAGFYSTCAVLRSGKARCWGSGLSYLGYGNAQNIGDNERPSQIGDVNVGAAVKQIANGSSQSCALLVNGRVRCWGYGIWGQLGAANTDSIQIPATGNDAVIGGTVTQIAAGNEHTCVLLSTGKVRCWGPSTRGQLGYANTSNVGDDETPASAGDVKIGGDVKQIAVGSNHTCALLTSGSVRCWGIGTEGRLGYGNTNDIGDDETPAAAGDVNIGAKVKQIVAGDQHTCALLVSGSILCWGNATEGVLGYKTSTLGDDETPYTGSFVEIEGAVESLEAGAYHTCALLKSGKLRCWGYGRSGQLGYGNSHNIGDDETPASAGDISLGF